jgi:hypothetical protein
MYEQHATSWRVRAPASPLKSWQTRVSCSFPINLPPTDDQRASIVCCSAQAATQVRIIRAMGRARITAFVFAA